MVSVNPDNVNRNSEVLKVLDVLEVLKGKAVLLRAP